MKIYVYETMSDDPVYYKTLEALYRSEIKPMEVEFRNELHKKRAKPSLREIESTVDLKQQEFFVELALKTIKGDYVSWFVINSIEVNE